MLPLIELLQPFQNDGSSTDQRSYPTIGDKGSYRHEPAQRELAKFYLLVPSLCALGLAIVPLNLLLKTLIPRVRFVVGCCDTHLASIN